VSLDQNEIDLQKLLQQQLHSLAQFGVSEIAVGNGEFAIDFSAEENEQNDGLREPVANASAGGSVPSSKQPAASVPASATASVPVQAAKLAATVPPVSLPNLSDSWGAATVHAERPAALELINAEVRDCTRCEELCTHRSQTVFGVGSSSARLVFVGERLSERLASC